MTTSGSSASGVPGIKPVVTPWGAVTAGAVGVDLFPRFQESEFRGAAIEAIGMRDHVHRALQLLPLSLMALLALVVGHEVRSIEQRAVLGGDHRVAEGAHRRGALEQSRGTTGESGTIARFCTGAGSAAISLGQARLLLVARASASKRQPCRENQEKTRAQDGSARHQKLLSKRGKAREMGGR